MPLAVLSRVLDKLLRKDDIPPRCPCCRQDDIPLERVGPIRYLCAVCARDFDAIRDGDEWRFDVRPKRHVARDQA